MPKISGLALGEIKKASGLGLGSIKKVSGLGLGLIWQDNVQRGMTKNGTQLIGTSQAIVPNWLAEDANSTVSGSNSLLIPSAGNYNLQLNAIVSANGSFGTVWVQFWIFKNNASSVVDGTQVPITRGTSGNVYSLTSPTPVALADNDLLSIRGQAQSASVITLASGITVWLRAIPA